MKSRRLMSGSLSEKETLAKRIPGFDLYLSSLCADPMDSVLGRCGGHVFQTLYALDRFHCLNMMQLAI